MILILFVFLLQSVNILVVDCEERNVGKIIEVFDLDLTEDIEVGKVLAWKISHNQTNFKQLLQGEINGPFQSNETVLILAYKAETCLRLYYWAGTEASLDDKKALARHAMMFYLLASAYYYEKIGSESVVHISREQRGIETNSFDEALSGLINRTPVIKPKEYPVYHLEQEVSCPSKFPGLYAVRGKERTRIKKIPLHADWLKVADACLILEVGIHKKGMVPINILCGPKSSDFTRWRSELFAMEFYAYWYEYSWSYDYIRFIKGNNPSGVDYLKRFEEIVEAGNQHNLHEIDDPDDRLGGSAEEFVKKRDGISLFYTNAIFRNISISRRPIHSRSFIDKHGVYLLDTKSGAGIFLIVGKFAPDDVKMKAVEAAEEYLHENFSNHVPIRVRILKSNADGFHSNIYFNIHLADWPGQDKLRGKFW